MKHFTLTLMVAAAMMSAPAIAQNKVTNLSANTTRLNVELVNQTEQTVQLSRYFFHGYNTLCLPLSVSSEQLTQAGLKAERLQAIGQEGNVLNLYFVDCTAEGIEAGMPYLIYSDKAQYFRIKNTEAMNISTEAKNVRFTDNEGNAVTFGSSWESIERVGRYGIPAQQDVTPLQSVLVRTEADKTFLPTRCGFSWDTQSATAQELRIQHVSPAEITAIAKVSTGVAATVDVYDLKGNVIRRQASAKNATNGLPAGVYVIGGEKVVVR